MIFNTLLVAASLLVTTVYGGIATYKRPSLYGSSGFFDLSVNGTAVYTVSYDGYDYAQLSMDEGFATEFKVTVSDATSISSYSITPKNLNIAATKSGNTLTFSLSKAHYLIIKINDEKEFVIVADPTETDVPASKGDGIFNVLDYKADNTGASITTGIQDALHAASVASGGIVYVPEGTYQVGNLIIANNTSLYLAGGSVLRFTGNPADYNQNYTKSDLGPGTWWIRTAFNTANIKIYGRGTIDGNGSGYQKGGHVAQMIVPISTQNFRADGLLIRDSSFWSVVPTQSQDVTLTNLKILNRMDMVQNDGIDVVESSNVKIDRAIAIAHDDSFTTKTFLNTGIFAPMPHAPMPVSDVSFTNCLSWTRCYGYKVGQGVFAPHAGVIFSDSVVYTAAVGLGVDHKFGSGTASNITWRNIEIEGLDGVNLPGVATWLAVFVENENQGVGGIEDIVIDNIRIWDLGDKIAYIQGYDSTSMVKGAALSNIYLNDNTTPTTSLAALKLTGTKNSEGITIK